MRVKLTEEQRKQRRIMALLKWIRKLTDEAIRLQMELNGQVPAPMSEGTGVTRKFRIDLDKD